MKIYKNQKCEFCTPLSVQMLFYTTVINGRLEKVER